MKTKKYRTEVDSFGEVKIPEKALWGIQTQRSLQNFEIGKERQPLEIIHIHKSSCFISQKKRYIMTSLLYRFASAVKHRFI